MSRLKQARWLFIFWRPLVTLVKYLNRFILLQLRIQDWICVVSEMEKFVLLFCASCFLHCFSVRILTKRRPWWPTLNAPLYTSVTSEHLQGLKGKIHSLPVGVCGGNRHTMAGVMSVSQCLVQLIYPNQISEGWCVLPTITLAAVSPRRFMPRRPYGAMWRRAWFGLAV